MPGNLVEGIIVILFRFIIEGLIFYTGEILLYIFSFGKRQPFWKRTNNESIIKSYVFIELSWWVGLGFWIITIATITKFFI